LLRDRGYSSIELGLRCRDQHVALITPLRLDANLFAPPPRSPRQTGRPRVKGERLPKLGRVRADPQTTWHHSGHRPLPIRWVLVRDPTGKHAPKAYLCTDVAREPLEIVQAYMKRWPLEVTFEEMRAHLGWKRNVSGVTKRLSGARPWCWVPIAWSRCSPRR
jgi:hypothetical protein